MTIEVYGGGGKAGGTPALRLRASGRPAAAYCWHRGRGGVIVVIDIVLPGCQSVASDAAGVVADLAEWYPSALAAVPLIVYRDPMGHWDGLRVGPAPGLAFAGFKHLNAAKKEDAIRLALASLNHDL